MLAVVANESNMHAAAIRKARDCVHDVGLTGIRCIEVDRKCTNGAARGYTIAQLMEPTTNIRVAHALATSMGARWLDHWNGDPGYAARIHMLKKAIEGVPTRSRRACCSRADLSSPFLGHRRFSLSVDKSIAVSSGATLEVSIGKKGDIVFSIEDSM